MEELATEVRGSRPADMEALGEFVFTVDAALGRLSDERAVRPGRYCLPRHRHPFQPSFLELICSL